MTQIYVEAKVPALGQPFTDKDGKVYFVSSCSHARKGVWVDAVNTFDALDKARNELGPTAWDFTICGLHNSRAAFEKITGVATSEADTFADTVFAEDKIEQLDRVIPYWLIALGVVAAVFTIAAVVVAFIVGSIIL